MPGLEDHAVSGVLRQEIMRKAMDMELLQALVTKLQSTFYTSVDMDFCKSLISDAAWSHLADL